MYPGLPELSIDVWEDSYAPHLSFLRIELSVFKVALNFSYLPKPGRKFSNWVRKVYSSFSNITFMDLCFGSLIEKRMKRTHVMCYLQFVNGVCRRNRVSYWNRDYTYVPWGKVGTMFWDKASKKKVMLEKGFIFLHFLLNTPSTRSTLQVLY